MDDESTAHRAEIATRLRMAREAAGLSQGQVAKKLNLHRTTISEIEAGRRRVSAEELSGLADIYGIDANWIVHGSNQTGGSDKILLAARQLSKLKGLFPGSGLISTWFWVSGSLRGRVRLGKGILFLEAKDGRFDSDAVGR